MATDWKNKVVIITGASTGIGRSTKLLLREKGSTVINLDTKPGTDDGPGEFLSCDVRSREEVMRTVNTVREQTGRIDMLFANAGVHHVATLEGTDEEVLDRLIAINIKGVFHALQAVIPIMRAQGGGSIVLMGSDQCLIGKGASAAYGLTKGAIGQLTKSTAIDVARDNIRVNCICPGTIDTPLLHRAVEQFGAKTQLDKDELMRTLESAQPIGRIGQPEEIASAVAYMLSDEASFMTGALISVDGGYVAQ